MSSVRAKRILILGGKKESSASSHETPDGQNHCLVMDEVDGMAGNEDRGGMAVSMDH